MLAYIEKIIHTLCVEDPELAKKNLATLTDTIFDQVKHMDNHASKQEIRRMLVSIQTTVNN